MPKFSRRRCGDSVLLFDEDPRKEKQQEENLKIKMKKNFCLSSESEKLLLLL